MSSTKTIGFITTSLAATAAVTVLSAPVAQAQAPFRVLRPATGAKVRETTRIQFSRSALGEAKYVQLFVDGLFRSAIAIPPASKKATHTEQIEANASTVSLLWNTKAIDNTPGIPDDKRVVTDGPHTIEVVGLDIAGRRIGRDTVTLNVANRSGLVMPASGIPMNYRFAVGDSTNYQQRAEVNFILADNQNPQGGSGSPYGGGAGQRAYYGSQRQGSSYGGRPGGGGPGGFPGAPGGYPGGGGGYPGGGGGYPGGGGGYPGGGGDGTDFNPIVPVQNVRATFERSTEDRAGGNAYFIRDKVLRGIIIGGNGSAARLEQVYDFKSRYRTVESSGKVLNTSTASRPGAYVALLLPNLGGGNRRTGAKWRTPTPIQLEWATLDTPPMVYADNELEGLEWQDGVQTARIRQTFNGQVKMPIFGGAGVMNDAKVSMDRTIWFGYKTGKIIRMVTKVTVEGDAPQSVISQMAPGAATAGGGQGGFPGAGGGGRFGGPAGFPGAGDEGLLGAPSQGAAGGFGALQGIQGQGEAAKVPAKFQSTITVTLNRGGGAGTSRVASR
jgi:hypothetical protein